jgi:membrane-associated phospholipid phosphatase
VPSLHAAYALGVGVGLVVFGRWLAVRIAGAVYPPLVVLTTIVTGNHFFLDAIAGVAVLTLGFAGAWRLEARRAQQDDGPRPACLT